MISLGSAKSDGHFRGRSALLLGALASVLITACASAGRVRLRAPEPGVPIAIPALYPETIETNPTKRQFLISSMREGAVYEVALDGSASKLVDDPRLTAVLGIAVDARTGRLWVTNADLGIGIKHSERGPRREAGVGIYELATGKPIRYVDLTPLLPDEHLINGITVDDGGNAYVTDSFSPTIYKVDPEGKASIFLRDEEFRGPGVNLNGIVYHPEGFARGQEEHRRPLSRSRQRALPLFTSGDR